MFLATRRSAQSQKCRIRYENAFPCICTTYRRMRYMGSAWKESKQGKMDVCAATFSQRELCQITGLDTVTVDTWLIRGILETTKVDGRVLRGRRLFSVLTIFDFHAEICREHGLVPLDFVGRVFCYGAAAVEHVNA